MLKTLLVTSLLLLAAPYKQDANITQLNGDAILGKWTSEDKKLVVEMYRSGAEYRGKMVWFKDDDSKPMSEWTDKHNPDEKLRNRKLLGMDVVTGLKYDHEDKSYNDGHIYEAKSGKTWNATAKLASNDVLKVKGYWHVKFIGRTMTFMRVVNATAKN
ncbi:DUF2147 domain-containing protein [Mucilaginibacter roseus]|uniref:DUF2147 domain-containing protein n=1 Tax=Mucilaginibacter roseus TaxID=1528868 RepID=A0ABS8U430_9SPHI|nr:DUF2147 domain-containing protein [Mucilaginibacter roseus]MCD8740326.1 DUF2147 domain-containing protein [Mucilaginibacter roseus]